MNKTRNIIIGLVIIVAIVDGGFWLWQSQTATAAADDDLEATGVIEARTVSLAPEVGGQVLKVLVEEGERIRADESLLQLDESLLQAQRIQAVAALEAVQAQLALLQAGARDEQIAAAAAQLAQAEAGLRLAESNLALLQSGVRIEQISAAEAQLAQAEAGVWAAQSTLDALTAGTRPELIAATQTSLIQARERYRSLRVSFTTDQLEVLREAVTTATDNLAAAMTHLEDHIGNDTRNPKDITAVFANAVADAETAVSFSQQAYDAALDDALPLIAQIELARQSWELAQTHLVQAQARYDSLADDDRVTADALAAAQDILDGAQDLETAVQTAYEKVTTGSTARQLDAAWAEVQRLQAQLSGYALGLAGGSTTPPVETLLAQVDTAVSQSDLATANMEALVNGARDEEITAAQAQVDAAIAQQDMAAANLAALVNGARDEEIAAAQAQVNAAQAQLDSLDIQLAKFTLTAP
ncbi:MAG: biotin/lipoyl-binding protein, partial [Anaerolineae bacterium]